jgi:hypothetical protein
MNNGLEPTNQNLSNAAEELTVQNEVSSETSLEQTPLNNPQVADPEPPKRRSWRRVAGLSLLGLGVVAIAALILFSLNNSKKQDTSAQLSATARIKSQTVPLADLSKQLENASAQELNTLTINGEASVSNSLILQPTARPDNATAGQIYYDTAKNLVRYYNGKQFINLQGAISTQTINVIGGDTITNVFGSTVNNNVTNITNVSGGGVSVTSGTVGTLAMFTGASSIGDSLVSQSGSVLNLGNSATGIQLGNSAANHNIQIGTGNGVQTVSVGSSSTTSATTIQAGTGNLNLITGNASGVSGDLNISTGNSATTASGNISIDTGSGVVSGLLIENKTFEGGLESMNSWFNSTIAQSTAQAHGGTNSLAATATAANWGIIETLPGVSVTPGHQYFISVWVRAATTPRSIIGKVAWVGGTGTVSLTPISDNTTGWTEMTALAPAPAGATSAYFEIQALGTNGEVHYFDDMTVTDLSSSAAASIINIGNTNAKIITLGNLNQLGATTINGGSGVAINSGAAGMTLSGGTVDITGNAASSFTTTAGALTLTSNATAIWGIGTPSSGAGGDLTLRAGHGGTDDNNDGGNLYLQGGRQNGTGLPGGVIVQPQTDGVNTFVIQNSGAVPLFAADTSALTITVSGTASNFGTLVLDNAHFKSTQTTAPTIATPTNCGTTPTAAVTSGSTDTAGSFTITTGTGGTSSTCATVITFDKPYSAAPKSILIAGKTDAASAARQIYVSASNANSFTVTFGASAAGADNTDYHFNYWVVE